MRTIKFKGKRLDNGEWVVGDLAHSLDGTLNILCFDTKDGVTSFSGSHRIAPQTVCQFTGFTDKNGREIYEGDVLRSDLHPFSFKEGSIAFTDLRFVLVDWLRFFGMFSLLVYSNKQHENKVSDDADGSPMEITMVRCYNFEVVGSIHDVEWRQKLILEKNK